MKHQVIEALRKEASNPKERFQELFTLYRSHPESLPGLNRSFNARGYSPVNLQSLEYELKKVYGVSDKDVADTTNYKPTKEMRVVLDLSDETVKNLSDFDFDNADYRKELLPLAKAVSSELKEELPSQKKVDIIAYLQSKIPAPVVEAVNPFLDAPEDVKQGIKLRDQFPFLTDADCPDKFKILVADKFTAHATFVGSREDIKKMIADGATFEDLFELAKKAVENFELNLDIYDELNYYNEHKQILGKHPIFKEEMMNESVEAMTTKELIKRQKNLRSYISREEKVLEKMKEGDEKVALSEKIVDWKHELELVDKRVDSTK